MQAERLDSWLSFTIRDTEGVGVDLPKLAKLLGTLSSTFYAIARTELGVPPDRPGPRTNAEDLLAGLRLARLEPGSAVLELLPPEQAVQSSFDFRATADDVAFEFVQELRRIASGETVAPERTWIRRQVRNVITDAGDIGAVAEVRFNPQHRVPRYFDAGPLEVQVNARELPEQERPAPSRRTRRVIGHAYMVDVEPGKQRVRLKLTDGRDLTLDIAAREGELDMTKVLDRPVEVEVEEEMMGDASARRVATEISVLSSFPGAAAAPKSLVELMREQHLPKDRPDYRELATAVWQTKAELDEFEQFLRASRAAGG